MHFIKNLNTHSVTCIRDIDHQTALLGRRVAVASLKERKGCITYVRDIPYLYGDTMEDLNVTPRISIKSHHLRYRLYGSNDKSSWNYLFETSTKLSLENAIKVSHRHLYWENLGDNHTFIVEGGEGADYRFYQVVITILNSDHAFHVVAQVHHERRSHVGHVYIREIMDDNVFHVRRVRTFAQQYGVAMADVYRAMKHGRLIRIGERYYQFSDTELFPTPVINRISARYMCRFLKENNKWTDWSKAMSTADIAKALNVHPARAREIVRGVNNTNEKHSVFTKNWSIIIRPYKKLNTINYLISDRKGKLS